MRKRVYWILGIVSFLGIQLHAGWEEGVAAFKAKNWQEAARHFEQVTKEKPEWAGGYFMLGQTYMKMGKYPQAVKTLNKAYNLAPNDSKIKLQLSNALVKIGKFEDAVVILDTIDPATIDSRTQAFFYKLKIAALQGVGKVEEAFVVAKSAAEKFANNPDILYLYGKLALARKNGKEAVKALKKAAQAKPSDLSLKRTLVKAYILAARESRDKNRKILYYKEAVSLAKEISARSNKTEDLLMLGEVQLGAKMFDEAINTFSKLRTRAPNNWYVYYYLGQSYAMKNEYKKAENVIKKALDIAKGKKQREMSLKQLGFVYEKQKRFADAKKVYQEIGDQAGLARVIKSEEIAKKNKEIEEHNKRVEELKKQEEQLKKELEELEGDL